MTDSTKTAGAPARARRTPLYDAHVAAAAKLVDFAGWRLPINYGSQVGEHHAVRRAAGMFDVSHMTIVDIEGAGSTAWLRHLLTGDVARLAEGAAVYGCLCNETGGVIDDLIAYRLGDERYRVVINAATRKQDLAWLESHRPEKVSMRVADDLALIAVQGPHALDAAQVALDKLRPQAVDLATLARFTALSAGDVFVGRTGYTGEDGVEVALPAADSLALWDALLEAEVEPCGLGARDTLRLEAGMCLYGNDLDLEHTPIESGIGWAVDLADADRDFIGREILAEQREFGGRSRRVGLMLEGRAVLRRGQPVELVGQQIGEITSGSYSPTLECSIAFARVARDFTGPCDVVIRGTQMPARRVKIPFVRNGVANI